MSRVVRWVALALLLAGTLPLAAQDKKADKNKPKANQDITPLVQAGEAVGKITKLGTGTITLQLVQAVARPRVTTRTVPVPGKRGARTRVPVETAQVRTVAKEYELETVDDVIVRVMDKPVQFDDKGKPKPYTSEELKELKGPDPSLPGYRSEFDSLKVGQTIRVTFGRKATKSASKDKDADNDKDKDKKDKDKEKKAAEDDKSRVGMIVVLAEGQKPTSGKPKDKDQ
jgi:hypothetical protein